MNSTEAAARATPPGRLFAAFERLSGQELRLSYMRQSAMAQLCSRGVTEADIEQVFAFTRAMMAKGKCGFNELSLTFGAMLADPDRFEDRLAAARAWKRPAKREPKPDAAPAQARPDPALYAAGAAAMAAVKAQLRGGGA